VFVRILGRSHPSSRTHGHSPRFDRTSGSNTGESIRCAGHPAPRFDERFGVLPLITTHGTVTDPLARLPIRQTNRVMRPSVNRLTIEMSNADVAALGPLRDGGTEGLRIGWKAQLWLFPANHPSKKSAGKARRHVAAKLKMPKCERSWARDLVERRRIELPTFALRTRRSPS
jgi:hypothetical protein